MMFSKKLLLGHCSASIHYNNMMLNRLVWATKFNQPQYTLQQHRFVTVNIKNINDINKNSNNKSKNKNKKNTKRPAGGVGRQSYRFVDRTRCRVMGGSGGKGSTSMAQTMGRGRMKRPDGGHGGHGGSVIIVANSKEQTLKWTHPHVAAASGSNGTSQGCHGKNGKHRIINVPCGVVVKRILDYNETWDTELKQVILHGSNSNNEFDFDNEEKEKMLDDNESDSGTDEEVSDGSDSDSDSDDYMTESDSEQEVDTDDDSDDDDDDDDDDFTEDDDDDDNNHLKNNRFKFNNDDDNDEWDENFMPISEREKIVVADLDKPGSFVVVAKGGRGGRGSISYAGRKAKVPNLQVMARLAKPTLGETAHLELELKMIADLGLVGFPNAGKSSLLSAMSRATPEIAPYPFTTLHPLVGYIEYHDGFQVCAADIPGLIAGASLGRGKGHDFLRHIERTKALLFMVDAGGVDGRDPISDLQVLVNELSSYGNGDIMTRHSLVVANKIDLLSKNDIQSILSELYHVSNDLGIRLMNEQNNDNLSQNHNGVFGISAGVTGKGLPELSRAIRNVVSLKRDQEDDDIVTATAETVL